MTYKIPPPPEGRFGKWAYLLWDFVSQNRSGAATNIAVVSPIVANTGTSGLFTLSHNTSGVGAGTYGTGLTWPRLTVDSRGHVTVATVGGTLGSFAGFNSIVAVGAVTGTTTTGTLTTGRTLVSVSDVLGTTTTGTLTAVLSTTGVTAGTYGTGRVLPQIVVDAKGRLTSAGAMGTLGTFGGFNSYVLTGDALGTSTTGTMTTALRTTGVAAGVYGGDLGIVSFDVASDGRLLSVNNIPPVGVDPIIATGPGGTWSFSHNTSGVGAGTFGGNAGVPRFTVNALGHLTAATAVNTLTNAFTVANDFTVGTAISDKLTLNAGTTFLSTIGWVGTAALGALDVAPVRQRFDVSWSPGTSGTGAITLNRFGVFINGTGTFASLRSQRLQVDIDEGAEAGIVIGYDALLRAVSTGNVTGTLIGYNYGPAVNSSGNVANLVGYRPAGINFVGAGTAGAYVGFLAPNLGGTSLGTAIGFQALDQEADVAIAFEGQIGTGTNRFNLWITGAAPNAMLGGLTVGGTGTAVNMLDVVGTSTAIMGQFGTATGGLSRWGTASASLVQTVNAAVTGTATAAGLLLSGTATGIMSQWGTATGGFSRWGTGSATLWQAVDALFAGTGTAAGWLVSGTTTGAMSQWGTATGGFTRWGTSSAAVGLFGTSSATLVKGTNAAFTGTTTSQGAYANAGSSTTVYPVEVIGYNDITPVSLTTVAGTLMKFGVPANAMIGTGMGMSWTMWGTTQVGVGNSRFALTFGTATLQVGTGLGNGQQWTWEGHMLANASGQEYFARFLQGTQDAIGTAQTISGSLGINLSTVTTLCIVGTGTIANNVRTQRGMIVRLINI